MIYSKAMTKQAMASPHHRNISDYKIISDPQHGYKRLDPIPTKEALAEMYSKTYYQDHYPTWIAKTLSEKSYWLHAYEERYVIFEKHIQTPGKAILDIGSFLGIFLEVGQTRGWRTLGIEPSDPARDYANGVGIKTLPNMFQDHTVAELGQFDAINLALTLEHIDDPVDLISRIHQFLKPGGILCIEVPNDFNPLQKAAQTVLGAHEYWVAPPHHINYFTPESLGRLLENTGFDIVHRTTTFPMELFLLMGQNYIGQDAVGRQCHQQRMSLEENLKKAGLHTLKDELYALFAKHNVGREIVIFGQKR